MLLEERPKSLKICLYGYSGFCDIIKALGFFTMYAPNSEDKCELHFFPDKFCRWVSQYKM